MLLSLEMGPGSIWDGPPPSDSLPENVPVNILSISSFPYLLSIPAERSLETVKIPTACGNLASAPHPPEPVFPSPLLASAVHLHVNQKPVKNTWLGFGIGAAFSNKVTPGPQRRKMGGSCSLTVQEGEVCVTLRA